MGLSDDVRRHCASLAKAARWVRIDAAAPTAEAGIAGLDPEIHLLDAPPEEVARYVLVLDAINFGSGWFPTLDVGDESPTDAFSRRLTEHARGRGGPWTAPELRVLDAAAVAEVLQQDAQHELMDLYAQALVQLGRWLDARGALDIVAASGGSAQRLAADLAGGMPFFDDRGFYKRAQITANDLALAGVAEFGDIDELTVFADNLLPHVLRTDGVLVYDDDLAALVDAGEQLPAGGAMERELRACTVHACELLARRLGVPPRTLDNWLWNRGQQPPYSDRPAHITRTVFY
jgi:Potential Queuosine, Q, salvage protein family